MGRRSFPWSMTEGRAYSEGAVSIAWQESARIKPRFGLCPTPPFRIFPRSAPGEILVLLKSASQTSQPRKSRNQPPGPLQCAFPAEENAGNGPDRRLIFLTSAEAEFARIPPTRDVGIRWLGRSGIRPYSIFHAGCRRGKNKCDNFGQRPPSPHNQRLALQL